MVKRGGGTSPDRPQLPPSGWATAPRCARVGHTMTHHTITHAHPSKHPANKSDTRQRSICVFPPRRGWAGRRSRFFRTVVRLVERLFGLGSGAARPAGWFSTARPARDIACAGHRRPPSTVECCPLGAVLARCAGFCGAFAAGVCVGCGGISSRRNGAGAVGVIRLGRVIRLGAGRGTSPPARGSTGTFGAGRWVVGV